MNVVPFPGVDATSSLMWWYFAMACTIERPSPYPSCSVRATFFKPVEDGCQLFSGYTDAGVRHREAHAAARRQFGRQGHAATLRELHGVGQQVVQDLLEPPGVRAHRLVDAVADKVSSLGTPLLGAGAQVAVR